MDEERRPTTTDVSKVWGAPLTAMHCTHCGEAHLVPEEETVPRCPFCLQETVVPQPAYLREEPPEQILPYEISERQLDGILERWAKGILFRPTDLRPDELRKRARRYFFPLWLVDGRMEADWRADVGFDYQVVSYQDRYRDGAGWNSQEVEETRVRWEPRVGHLKRAYENVASPALDDHHALMARLGGFDLGQRNDYTPEKVADAAVRIPSLDTEAAWAGAEDAFVRTGQAECQQAAGADHIRDFTLEAEYGSLNWTLLLLPAYVTWYEEGGQTWPLLINGQSGRVSGVRRASARKATTTSLVLGTIALILFIVGGLGSLLGAMFPPALAVGGIILVLGVLLAIVAPIPAIGAWVFNRRTQAAALT